MQRYFLGIDGGQSSTSGLIGDETGHVLGLGRSGACNHVNAEEAREKFLRIIGECVERARQAASLDSLVEFTAVCGGFSGGGADKDALIGELFPSAKRRVTHDALVALSGAHAGQPGIITIAGTGSISFGRRASGQIMRAGGWGYVFGDEGGGFDLTRQALRAALRMEEGWGPPTSLRESLLKATGAKDANEALHRFYSPDFPRSRVASLSGLVDAAASAGDRIAEGLLQEAAQRLAGITSAVRGKLFQTNECAPVAYIGGVFKSDRVREQFTTLVERDGQAKVSPPKFGPAAGALLEAYRLAGLLVELTGLPESEK